MIFNELWLIYALVFGAALLGVQGAYWVLVKGRQEQTKINRRLALTAQLGSPSEVLEILRKERSSELLASIPALRGLSTVLVQSGMRLKGLTVVLMLGIPGVLFYLLLKFLFASDLVAVGLAIPVAFASFYLLLQRARRRRIAAFSEQFPDAIDVIVRGLRAGHPFRVALALVAREMPDPVGSEFGIVADEITFGLEQHKSVDNLVARVGMDDLTFFATAVNIQSETGGNLAEVLARLSRLLRNRSKLRLKIRALSSEGRLSAIALSAMPFVLFLLISLLSPDYFTSVQDHPLIPPAIALGLLMLLIGNFVMYRMVNFKF